MAFSAHQRRRALHFAAMPTAIRITALALTAVAATTLTSATGAASPFCFETGPGYQKCVVSGHDLTPIYQGPKIYDGGNVPWVPNAPAPVYVPSPVYIPPAANVGGAADYVSLATPSSKPYIAAYGVAMSQEVADAIAIAQCQSGSNLSCQITARAYHACTAFAVNTDGSITNGIGPDIGSARTGALSAGGQVVGAYCSDPPGRS